MGPGRDEGRLDGSLSPRVEIVVLSDTHIPDFARTLPPALYRALEGADQILHAGDVTSAALLDELATFAPVHVAMGNGDGWDVDAWGAKEEVEIELEGIRVAMVHDSGRADGRARRLRRRFPRADVVVFGHSHIPVDAETDGLRLFNPGSPTWKRRQPKPTYGRMVVRDGTVRTRIVEL